jgi:hypothetical protein
MSMIFIGRGKLAQERLDRERRVLPGEKIGCGETCRDSIEVRLLRDRQYRVANCSWLHCVSEFLDYFRASWTEPQHRTP